MKKTFAQSKSCGRRKWEGQPSPWCRNGGELGCTKGRRETTPGVEVKVNGNGKHLCGVARKGKEVEGVNTVCDREGGVVVANENSS